MTTSHDESEPVTTDEMRARIPTLSSLLNLAKDWGGVIALALLIWAKMGGKVQSPADQLAQINASIAQVNAAVAEMRAAVQTGLQANSVVAVKVEWLVKLQCAKLTPEQKLTATITCP